MKSTNVSKMAPGISGAKIPRFYRKIEFRAAAPSITAPGAAVVGRKRVLAAGQIA